MMFVQTPAVRPVSNPWERAVLFHDIWRADCTSPIYPFAYQSLWRKCQTTTTPVARGRHIVADTRNMSKNQKTDDKGQQNPNRTMSGRDAKDCGQTRQLSDIQPHMDVISSCGCTMGKVDHLEGNSIKLTKNDSPDGQHHFIPTNWVESVDNHVHLRKNAEETLQEWKTNAASSSNRDA
jgi:hypothetical protein